MDYRVEDLEGVVFEAWLMQVEPQQEPYSLIGDEAKVEEWVEDHYGSGDTEDSQPGEPAKNAEYDEAGGETAEDAEVEWTELESVTLDEDYKQDEDTRSLDEVD